MEKRTSDFNLNIFNGPHLLTLQTSTNFDKCLWQHLNGKQTWMFQACMLLKADQTFLNLLISRKEPMTNSLATASVISWACADTLTGLESQDFETVHVEGFVSFSTAIWLRSLKRVLSENGMTDAGKLLQIALEKFTWPQKWLYVPTIPLSKIIWRNLSGSACCWQTNSGRFLLLKCTRVTTCPNNYKVWARRDWDEMLEIWSICGNLQIRGCHQAPKDNLLQQSHFHVQLVACPSQYLQTQWKLRSSCTIQKWLGAERLRHGCTQPSIPESWSLSRAPQPRRHTRRGGCGGGMAARRATVLFWTTTGCRRRLLQDQWRRSLVQESAGVLPPHPLPLLLHHQDRVAAILSQRVVKIRSRSVSRPQLPPPRRLRSHTAAHWGKAAAAAAAAAAARRATVRYLGEAAWMSKSSKASHSSLPLPAWAATSLVSATTEASSATTSSAAAATVSAGIAAAAASNAPNAAVRRQAAAAQGLLSKVAAGLLLLQMHLQRGECPW